ncbi:hypothetical protein M0805_000507 [Coniferiporia weirii]|nr:hypothetical protein M0805_000507 [Coniferiporia weirii]
MDHAMPGHDQHQLSHGQFLSSRRSSSSASVTQASLSARYNQVSQLSASQDDDFYPAHRPRIDVEALAAGVQRYIPSAPGRAHSGYPSNSYIALPPGVDPATVDFRTFYPYNPSEVKHRKRTTRPQLKVLEETFKKETKPNAALRKSLASQLEMTPRGVQVWFQNRRAKEKNLAKKATSSARKSVMFDHLNEDGLGDADGDADCDEEDAVDISNADCEYSSYAGQSALISNDKAERGHSNSSSDSPESTSPESTPPNLTVDIPPQVNVSPPVDEDGAMLGHGTKQVLMTDGLGASWQNPLRSMSRTPTSGLGVGIGADANVRQMENANITPTPNSGQFSRRPSLPTHLGVASSHGRVGPHSSTRGVSMGMNSGGVGAVRFAGFDPSTRRMSLDRLAVHPYAHLAVQANGMVYGPGATRFRPTLPGTTHSTPTLTPQAHTSELPSVQEPQTGDNSIRNDCDHSELAEHSLPIHLPTSPSAPELRPELLHRQSLPAQFAHHVPPSLARGQTGPLSGSHLQTRFSQPGNMYAFSTRSYQPPIPGPLPNPDFSFGSPRVEDGENVPTDNNASGSGVPGAQQQSSQFSISEGRKDENDFPEMGMDTDAEPDPRLSRFGARPALYFPDTHGMHGGVDRYATRFGSIASIASIAESESSATSNFYSEVDSFDVQQDSAGPVTHPPGGFNDARRSSCTGLVMGMFANLGVQNESSSSLSHHRNEGNSDMPSNVPHHQQAQSSQVPISKSSELACALTPDDGIVRANDGGYNTTRDSLDTMSFDQGHRSSLSSSESLLGYMHSAPPSANSSRSSLGMFVPPPSAPLRLDTDKLDFYNNFDDVSETGHYSPVSHPGSTAFDFPPSIAVNASQDHLSVLTGNGSIGDSFSESQGQHGVASHTYVLDKQPYSSEVYRHQLHASYPPTYPSTGPSQRDGAYQPSCVSSLPLHTNDVDNIDAYRYYS